MLNKQPSTLQKANRRNLFLLGLMLVLIAAVYLQKEIKNNNELIYLPIDINKLENISILQTPAITLIKQDKTWHVKQNELTPVNKKAMQDILDMLASPVRDEYSMSEVSLKELSLEPPNLQVILDREPLSFGTLSPIEQMHYVQFKDKVYLASPFLQVRFSQSLDTFLKPDEENTQDKNESHHGEH